MTISKTKIRKTFPEGNLKAIVSITLDNCLAIHDIKIVQGNSCRLTKVSTEYGTTKYAYDTLDRLTRVIDRNGYATVYEYDANGNRTAVKYANGLTVSYEYDKLNRLICEETVDSDSNVVVKYIYTLGASGERIKVEELDRTVEYTYDELYRLTYETITKGKNKTTYAYEYDSVSNRTLKTVNGVETVYTYNALNQLISENDTTYEYDNAGNLVRVIGTGKTARYVYNSENRLVRATVQEGNSVLVEEYEYDFAGNRTVKKSEGDYTRYLNDISGSLSYVLVEVNADGTEKCYYTLGAELVSQERDGNISYYLTDGHGSVRQLADENGKITDRYVYDAWGNLISSTGNTENSYLYCGEQYDSLTGLYYLRARYMNPETGTFISMDTYQGTAFEPVTLHKYLYANANPIMNSDPSGYFSLAETSIAQAISAELDKISLANVQLGMKILNALVGVCDIAKTIFDILGSGETGMDLAVSLACGIISSIILNFSCAILSLGGLGIGIFAVGALTMGFGIGYAINKGDSEEAITRAFQLVCIFFAAFAPSCFTGDTEIAAENGLVCIEDIEVGDKVWAYDPETGETALKEVLEVYIKEQNEILHLETSDGETIDTTTNHPFYVEDRGWVAAGDLEIGDVLYTVDGDTVEVTDIEVEKLAEPILVYNLEVEDFHTYFVGEYGVLVHNYKTKTTAGEDFGSYTIEYTNGVQYHGKGPISRMYESIERYIKQAFKDNEVIDYVYAEWKAADDEVIAFIDEYWRIINDGGISGNNYNKINSPGRKLYEKLLNELFG